MPTLSSRYLATLVVAASLIFPAIAQGKTTPTPKAAEAASAKKLDTGKLKSCQAHEADIVKRSDHMVQMATTMQTNFAAITTRVKDYYTTTVIPSGKTVSNYDALLTAISTKQSAVSTAVAKAQSDATSFSCTSDDPKGQLTQFRTDMQAVKSALKEYRTAIKNLIVAVHSVTGTESSATPSASPTITPTPGA